MYEKFVERLQIKGVKVADVARATNINPALFSEWKKGKSNPKIDKLQKIADYFGVPLSYFTGGDESENPPVYLDDETRAAVDMLRKRPEMRILFKASENATKQREVLVIPWFLRKLHAYYMVFSKNRPVTSERLLLFVVNVIKNVRRLAM